MHASCQACTLAQQDHLYNEPHSHAATIAGQCLPVVECLRNYCPVPARDDLQAERLQCMQYMQLRVLFFRHITFPPCTT